MRYSETIRRVRSCRILLFNRSWVTFSNYNLHFVPVCVFVFLIQRFSYIHLHMNVCIFKEKKKHFQCGYMYDDWWRRCDYHKRTFTSVFFFNFIHVEENIICLHHHQYIFVSFCSWPFLTVDRLIYGSFIGLHVHKYIRHIHN